MENLRMYILKDMQMVKRYLPQNHIQILKMV